MKLVYYPNKVLETKCEPVTVFDEQLGKELDEMRVIMTEHKGLGLASNQVGLNKRMFLIKDTKNEVHEIINPKIISTEGEVSISEGCLSAPSIFFAVTRPDTVEISYQDRNGNTLSGLAYGIDARAILHEYDHLEGVFFFSKVNRQTRKAAISQLRKTLK